MANLQVSDSFGQDSDISDEEFRERGHHDFNSVTFSYEDYLDPERSIFYQLCLNSATRNLPIALKKVHIYDNRNVGTLVDIIMGSRDGGKQLLSVLIPKGPTYVEVDLFTDKEEIYLDIFAVRVLGFYQHGCFSFHPK